MGEICSYIRPRNPLCSWLFRTFRSRNCIFHRFLPPPSRSFTTTTFTLSAVGGRTNRILLLFYYVLYYYYVELYSCVRTTVGMCVKRWKNKRWKMYKTKTRHGHEPQPVEVQKSGPKTFQFCWGSRGRTCCRRFPITKELLPLLLL